MIGGAGYQFMNGVKDLLQTGFGRLIDYVRSGSNSAKSVFNFSDLYQHQQGK